MSERRAFAYFDDNEDTIESFKKTVRKVWHLDHDVLSNSHFGRVDDSMYDEFQSQIVGIIESNLSRLECVFLDLDFSGNLDKENDDQEPDSMGFMLGREIRRRWPQLPIIIVSRFTEKEIIRKGLIFDFDDIHEGIALTQMGFEGFNGMLNLAKKKRQNILESFGDVPVSFRTGRNKYFRNIDNKLSKDKYAFVAIPYDEKVVSNDVWELGIKGALDELGIKAMRVDIDLSSRTIIDKIATYVFGCSFVVADLTGWNANVLYELGLAHASNKDCILLSRSGDVFSLPFDVQHIRVIKYEASSLVKLKTDLLSAVRQLTSTD